jgi:condensin complex subunit 1
MMGRAQREIIAENVQLLLTVGLGELARDDLVLARLACGALQQLARVKSRGIVSFFDEFR